jgi:N-acetylated-alpha-linked acidic dipeptidase
VITRALGYAALLALAGPRQAPRRLGYSPDAFRREQALEEEFRRRVSADSISRFHAALTRRPHLAGTDASRAVADSIAGWLRNAGLTVEMLEYQAYLSYPESVSVAIVSPVAEQLRVTEPASPLDPDTSNPELGPGFVAYSANGDVTAPVVYANYGLPPDYAELAVRGIDVRGKLVIARYGKSHSAVKLYTAQEHGAAGLLLYSDPADDGFVRGDTWPRGYWRTSDQNQRGNAKYSWYWHGDALTPGTPSLSGAPHADPATAPTLPRIPAAVLAWGQARKILERLDGEGAPATFRGGLPIPYKLGAGGVRVRLHVQMKNDFRTIRDVVAHVPGARLGDRGVLLGTHHDAWTFGGVDPGTGTATLLEVARSLGQLRRGGWRPERTISLAFWDAEEFGLIGSTEYAEQRASALRAGTICYINTDLYTNGRLDAGGAPSLRDVLVEIAKDVPDGTQSVYDAWIADERARAAADRRAAPGFEVELKALGSGADFVPFQDFLGLPTLSIEYNATGGYSYGPYHSNYDTRRFTERVADPGFRRGAALARLLGTVALRLGQAQVLPFRFSHYARRLDEFVTTASGWVADTAQLGRPERSEGSGVGRPTMSLDFAPLRAAVARAERQAAELERRVDAYTNRLTATAPGPARLNDLLARLEQRLLDESLPPDKRWYRHLVYGWNIYSLYDGQPFPGLAEAIRQKDEVEARRELAKITSAVNRLADGLTEGAALLP